MWDKEGDWTLDTARNFLRCDFVKIIRRTKYLYVEHEPSDHIGRGYFEPVLLCFCWCDFLGALYCGDGRFKSGIGSTCRSKRFIINVLGAINPKYKAIANDLVEIYRHGTVHAYAPAGLFCIVRADTDAHLTNQNGLITISLSRLLDDLLTGTYHFASTLHDQRLPAHGSLTALNKGRKQLRCRNKR